MCLVTANRGDGIDGLMLGILRDPQRDEATEINPH